MASSSSSRAGVPDIASEIHALVEKCCPKLRFQVEHWLRCYRDPQLLHESLRREYEVEVVDDSDEEETYPGPEKTTQPQPQHFSSHKMVPRGDVCKAMLCEAHLLEKCRWGEQCYFAHSEEELREIKRRRAEAERPKRSPASPGTSFLEVLPSDISFCHDTVAPDFKDGRSILMTLLGLANGEVKLRDVPMMEVVIFQDRLYSLSNRRLCLYMLCEHFGLLDKKVPVKVKLLEELPKSFRKKYTTTCYGEWVRVRRDGRICARSFEDTTFGRNLIS